MDDEPVVEEMIVHETGSEPVTVATFAGVRQFVALDVRPWPERMEEEMQRLDALITMLQHEYEALVARLDRIEHYDQR